MRIVSLSRWLPAALALGLTASAQASEPSAQAASVAPTAETPAAPASPAATPPPATTTPSGAVAPSPGQPTAAEGEQFDLKLKGLEEQVNDLKEKIFRTKSRLLLLQETVIGGDISTSAKAVIVHQNDMGSSFVLESAAYSLDGAAIFTKVDNSGDLADKPAFEIFNGLVVPGNHQISVKLVYRGHGYGLFSYLEGYKFKVQSSYTFNAEAGRLTAIKVVGFEKGGITTDLKERPSVRYDIEVSKERPPTPGQRPSAPSSSSSTGNRP
jgi:hypothetical protein